MCEDRTAISEKEVQKGRKEASAALEKEETGDSFIQTDSET